MNTSERGTLFPRWAELDAEFELLEELERGAAIVVYHARERDHGRDVILEISHPGSVGRAATQRLLAEAQAATLLQHPHIAEVHGLRRGAGDAVALVRAYVPGLTLRAALDAGGAQPFPRVARVLTEAAAALSHAHAHGVIHGGITPELLHVASEAGTTRLSGFGRAPASVQGGGNGGWYLAPEQLDGREPDARSDLYSLALVGWELLTGVPARAGSRAHGPAHTPSRYLPAPDGLRPGIPAPLQVALAGALREDPADRWSDVDAFTGAVAGRISRAPRAASVLIPPAADGAVPDDALAAPVPPVPGPAAAPTMASTAAELISRSLGHGTPTPPAPFGRQLTSLRRAAASPAFTVVGALALAGVLISVALGAWSAPPALSWEMGAPATAPASAGALSHAEEAAADVPAGMGAALMYALVGDSQEGFAGDTLPEPIVLRVEDADGRPLAGVPVRFNVRLGEGVIEPAELQTDAFGIASARWIPFSTGRHEADAAVATLPGRAYFRAVALTRDAVPATAVTGPGAAAAVTGAAGRGAAATGAATATAAPAGAGPAPRPAPALLPVRAGFALGGMHSCTLRRDGLAFCWGGNENGQLGDGTAARRAAAVAVAAPEPIASLAAGVSHTCGVAVSGALYCWGSNDAGQLGNGGTGRQQLPVRVATDERLTAVAPGLAHTCALGGNGRIVCWGQNADGQLGDDSRTPRTAPVPVSGGHVFRAVAAGWAHTCALNAEGLAFCWGRNGAGELGDGGTAGRATPAAVSGGHRFTAIAAGSQHTCGLRTDGAVLCWGRNTNGQLGNGSTTAALTPQPVAGTARYAALALGGVHSCALTADGAAHCWGRNAFGQLGDGATQDRAEPVEVHGGLRFTNVYANGAHTCGRTTAGRDHCWGYNVEGQLGTGTRANQNRPAAVLAGG